MISEATFRDIDDLARFCAGLTREHIVYTVKPGIGAGCYVVVIEGEEGK